MDDVVREISLLLPLPPASRAPENSCGFNLGFRFAPPQALCCRHEAQQNPILYYDRATFEPYVGGTFIGRDARGRTIELKLLRVTEYKPNSRTRITTAGTRGTDSFALTFNASRSLPEFTSIHSD